MDGGRRVPRPVGPQVVVLPGTSAGPGLEGTRRLRLPPQGGGEGQVQQPGAAQGGDGGGPGQGQGKDPKAVHQPELFHPADHPAAVGGLPGEPLPQGIPLPGEAGEDHPADRLLSGHLIGEPQPQGHPGQREEATAPHSRPEPQGLPPLRRGAGGQTPPAPEGRRQDQQQGDQGQGQGGAEEEVGQVAHVEDLKEEGCGQRQAAAHTAGGHGGHFSRGGRTEASTSPTGSPVPPASVRMRRWATVSRKISDTSPGRT